jgi:hypothetical protein
MTANQPGESEEISEEEIRSKRMTTLIGFHELMSAWKQIENTRLDRNKLTLTVEEYITSPNGRFLRREIKFLLEYNGIKLPD